MELLELLKNQILSCENLIKAYSLHDHLLPFSAKNQLEENNQTILRAENFMKIGKAMDYLHKKRDEFYEEYALALSYNQFPDIRKTIPKTISEPIVAIFYFQDSDSPHHDFIISNFLATNTIQVQLFRYFPEHVNSKYIQKFPHEKTINVGSKYRYFAINDFFKKCKIYKYAAIFPNQILVGNNWLHSLMQINDFPSIGFCTINTAAIMQFISLPSETDNESRNFLIAENNLFNGLCFFRTEILEKINPLPNRKYIDGREVSVLCYHASIEGFHNVAITNQSAVVVQTKEVTNQFSRVKYLAYLHNLKKQTNKKLRNE